MHSFQIGQQVRYVGDITEKPCDAIVDHVSPDSRPLRGDEVPLRLKNGALIYARPEDVVEIRVVIDQPRGAPYVWAMEFPAGARISE